jgi:hypothetical protein
MERPTTPQHRRVTSIQHDSNSRRTPSLPSSAHYCSSTKSTKSKANLKTVLAPRVSYKDPNIVDVLIKPNKVGNKFVKTMKEAISGNKDISQFLEAVREQTVGLESDMYAPLVRRAH